jgi:hypothetical protein
MQRITVLALAGLLAGSFAVSAAHATTVSGSEVGTVTGVGGSEFYTGTSGSSTFGIVTAFTASDTVSGGNVTGGTFTENYGASNSVFGSYTGTFSMTGATDTEILTITVAGGTGSLLGTTGTLTGVDIIDINSPPPDTFDLDFYGSVTTTVSPTPLPSTWVMMLAGLAAVGFFAARKKAGLAAGENSGFAAAA